MFAAYAGAAKFASGLLMPAECSACACAAKMWFCPHRACGLIQSVKAGLSRAAQCS